MNKTRKEIIILFCLGSLCLGLWLYIWKNIFEVRDEYLATYTGKVTYAWRWDKLPVRIHLDPDLKLSSEEQGVIAAHFNYFFQARLAGDLIEFTPTPGDNQAYIKLENHFPKEIDAYTLKDGHDARPAIYIDALKYAQWTPLKKRGVLMHEIGHLLGLPHFEHHPQGLMRAVQASPVTSLSDVEQELLIMLYSQRLGDELIPAK